MEIPNYKVLGEQVRSDVIRLFDKGGRGHIPSAFSMVELLNVLYHEILEIDPSDPTNENRDRLILSKGHGCLSLYAILCRKGFFEESHLDTFCHFGSILGGHPGHGKIPGVEAATGALGHGLSLGVGMSLAAKIDEKSYKTHIVLGDGECNEGSVWEAALSASKNKLDNLVLYVDYNKFQSYGPTREVLDLEPFADKWTSFGFDCFESDMNDVENLREILLNKVDYTNSRPTAIICHTIKGKGISFMENDLSWHHKSRATTEEIQDLYEAIKKGQ